MLTPFASLSCSDVVPVFLVSSVSGKNLALLKQFFNLLPAHSGQQVQETALEPADFQVEETYNVADVGAVVGGTVREVRTALRAAECVLRVAFSLSKANGGGGILERA